MATIWHIYPGTDGNAGAYIDALQKASEKGGIRSCAFVSRYYEFQTDGIIKYFFPITDGIRHRHRLLKYLRGFELVLGNLFLWLIASFRRPLINIHMAGYFPTTFLLFCLCKLVRLKVYVTCHDVAESNLRMSKWRMYVLLHADKLVVHSKAARDMLIKYSGASSSERIVQYSFPFSSCDSILSAQGTQKAQEVLNSILKKNTEFFLFSGPRECKGISTLIEAWKITEAKQKCALLIAGKWGDVPRGTREKLNQLDNCIVFEQYLTNEEFVYFIAKAKFVLLPYLNYAHSSVLISCAKHNGAVIISDIDLFKDYFSDYDMTFPKGNAGELAALLDKAVRMSHDEVRIRAELLKSSVDAHDQRLVKELIQAYKC